MAFRTLRICIVAIAAVPFGVVVDAALAATTTPATAPAAMCPAVTHVRFYPRKGFAQRMVKGRFEGSNQGPTTEFRTFAEIKDAPPEGAWTEIKLAKPVRMRFLKYQSPTGGWGNVAEVEFYAGDCKLSGTPFGTTGSRDNSGNDFAKAMDGNVETFFDGVQPNDQYVGIDLGAAVQAAVPEFSPKPGSYDAPQEVMITAATPGARIRYTRDWGMPSADSGELCRGPVRVARGSVLSAVAYTDDLAASPAVLVAYRIAQGAADTTTVRSFHIGNSLTDTVNGVLAPLAESAGRKLDFHRFTIPGAPTDWLWNHPGSGFGDSHYVEAFFALAPINHIITQPFGGHDRSIDNEAEYSGKFFELCRKHSPAVQPWLYVQWPGPKLQDLWSQAKGSTTPLKLKPATTWQEGVANHVAYAEAVARRIQESWKGKPVLIVPGGLALAALKTEIDAAKVPGMTDFVAETFADGIHMTAKGRYLVSLVHYACIWRQSPEGKAGPLNTGLTPPQLAIFQRIAWETARDYKPSGVASAMPALSPAGDAAKP